MVNYCSIWFITSIGAHLVCRGAATTPTWQVAASLQNLSLLSRPPFGATLKTRLLRCYADFFGTRKRREKKSRRFNFASLSALGWKMVEFPPKSVDFTVFSWQFNAVEFPAFGCSFWVHRICPFDGEKQIEIWCWVSLRFGYQWQKQETQIP